MGIKNILTDAFFGGTAVYVSDDYIDIARAASFMGGVRLTYLNRFPLSKNIKNLPYSDFSDDLEKIVDNVFSDESKKPRRLAVNITDNRLILRRFTMRSVPKSRWSNSATA